MTAADVRDVLDVQQPGAVLGLADVFPQDAYPFPRDAVLRRWEKELATPGVDCLVVHRHGTIVGFAAIRGDEFLHFGVAVEYWGTGIAQIAHDEVLDRMRSHGIQRAWLRVFTQNGRGRRFYEKLGWHPTGERTRSSFPPYPELLHYERGLTDPKRPAGVRGARRLTDSLRTCRRVWLGVVPNNRASSGHALRRRYARGDEDHPMA